LIALSTATVLGLVAASAARASDHEETGGFVMPGSMDGVNPAYHPGIFGNTAAAKAYGFAVPRQTQHAPHKQVQGR
jgi:ABC-type sugar transport system substrate-binding protein